MRITKYRFAVFALLALVLGSIGMGLSAPVVVIPGEGAGYVSYQAGYVSYSALSPASPSSNSTNTVGQVVAFPVEPIPVGWLVCDGSTVTNATYPELVSYLTGGASSSATLPDYRGEFLRGLDHGRGVDPARAAGSWQADELKSHSHRVPNTASSGTDGPWLEYGSWQGERSDIYTEPEGGSETRPRNMAVIYAIRAIP